MRTLEEIMYIINQHNSEIMRNYNVKQIGIFGSYIHSKQKKKSDVDLLIEFSKTPSLFRFIELENYLTEILGVKVDLVMKSALKPAIGKRILNEVVYL
jgi:uncharacterized protein